MKTDEAFSTKDALAILLCLGVCLFFALSTWPVIWYNDEFIPYGPDAAYHARRILDFANGLFYEFEPRLHAPDGAWLTWPWAFDLSMAYISKTLAWVLPGIKLDTVVALLPSLFLPVNVLLLFSICHKLGLRRPFSYFVLFFYCLSPLNSFLHQAGRIDHHFAEHFFVLAALAATLHALANKQSRLPAIVAGAITGFSMAFHNGLFVLQVPLIVFLFVGWITHAAQSRQFGHHLAIGLIIGMAVAVTPSSSFQQFHFDFYFLSWFHAYISICTTVLILFLTRTSRSPATIALLIALCGGLLIPVMTQVEHGIAFASGGWKELANIYEMRPVFSFTPGKALHWQDSLTLYSGLIYLLPVSLIALCIRAAKSPDSGFAFFAFFSLLCGLMMLSQFRFNYMGSFALLIPPAMFAQWLTAQTLKDQRFVIIPLFLLTLTLYAPCIIKLTGQKFHGATQSYALTKSIYPALKETCRQNPGVVLANNRGGNFILYHSDCSVIANDMVMQKQDMEKVQLSYRLLSLPPEAITEQAPYVSYVLISDISSFETAGRRRGLKTLLNTDAYPRGYELIHDAYISSGKQKLSFAKLFRVSAPTKQSM